jgi:AraC-like DNA-binding protein
MTSGLKFMERMAEWEREFSPMTTGANPLTWSVSAGEFRVFLDSFGPLGHDVEALAAGAGVTRADLDDFEVRVPCTTYETVVRLAQKSQPTPNLALRLAMNVPIGAFPPLDYLILTCDDVAAGLHQLSRYFRLVGNPMVHDVREESDPIRVVMNSAWAFNYEYSASIMILHFREETDERFAAASLHFTHRPDDVRDFERVLGCPVEAGAPWNGVTITREAWRLPLRRRDAVLRGILERQARDIVDRMPPAGTVAAEIRQLLDREVAAGNDTRIEAVARSLATSPRTLQRRLAAEGLSYQKVLDDWRKDSAQRHVAGSALSIGEIAYLLGFAEPAPFHRAFKRWFGVTPQTFRQGQMHLHRVSTGP